KVQKRTQLVRFFFQAEDGIRDFHVTGVQTCALPIYARDGSELARQSLTVDAPAVAVAPVRGGPDLDALVAEQGLVFVHLLLRDRSEERRVGKEGRDWWGA